MPQLQIAVIGLLNLLAKAVGRDRHVLQAGFKRRMPAMIGPIGIEHADFRFRRIALFFFAEVALNQGQISFAHR